MLTGDWKVPSPFPNSTENVFVPPSSRSGFPSPLKSATASATPGNGVPALKVPSPFPKSTTPEEHNRSGLPSPFTSATNKVPFEQSGNVAGGRNETWACTRREKTIDTTQRRAGASDTHFMALTSMRNDGDPLSRLGGEREAKVYNRRSRSPRRSLESLPKFTEHYYCCNFPADEQY